jgi:hypothetical protein
LPVGFSSGGSSRGATMPNLEKVAAASDGPSRV